MDTELAISIVVPCFNEESRLPASLSKVERWVKAGGRLAELVLVDDGSRDCTGSLIAGAARDHPYVRTMALPTNRGKGRALAEGVAVTSADLVLISDADFSAPIDELPKLETAITEGADIAIGSRAKKGAREVDQPVHRRLMGKGFNLAVQALLLPGLWDTQCGFKLFRGSVARELFAGLNTDGFAYDVEVLYRARTQGYRVAEVPVRWINSDSSRVQAFRHSREMFEDILRIRFGR